MEENGLTVSVESSIPQLLALVVLEGRIVTPALCRAEIGQDGSELAIERWCIFRNLGRGRGSSCGVGEVG